MSLSGVLPVWLIICTANIDAHYCVLLSPLQSAIKCYGLAAGNYALLKALPLAFLLFILSKVIVRLKLRNVKIQ